MFGQDDVVLNDQYSGCVLMFYVVGQCVFMIVEVILDICFFVCDFDLYWLVGWCQFIRW